MSNWQPIETAPRDGTLFVACNLDHPSRGVWVMCRNVRWKMSEAGQLAPHDLGAWIRIHSIDDLSPVGQPDWSIAIDSLNESVRYGWQPLPNPPEAQP